MKVIIDNGHGNNTPGKRSPVWKDGTQLFEYEFNRDICNRMYIRLITMGIDCVLLVPEIKDVSLSERVKRVNKIARLYEGSFLVSVHANAGGGTGWEAFTSKGETLSDIIATHFYNEAEKAFPQFRIRTDYSDGDVDKESQFYILRRTICPAVLTENFFMDTEKDCRYIMSEKGRKEIVQFHIVLHYINHEKLLFV